MKENTINLELNINDNGLKIWTFPNERFIVTKLRWQKEGDKYIEFAEEFFYSFIFESDNKSDGFLNFYLSERNGKRLNWVKVDSIKVSSSKLNFFEYNDFKLSIKLASSNKEKIDVFRRKKSNECDDLNFKDGLLRCCLWGDKRDDGFVIWENNIESKFK